MKRYPPIVIHGLNGHCYVWIWTPETTAEALRSVGRAAADGGITWHQAAMACKIMRAFDLGYKEATT